MLSTAALALACFIWGFAEASMFFLVPDILVGAAAAAHPEHAILFACCALLGALVGGGAAYDFGEHREEAYMRFLDRLPGHPAAFLRAVRAGFRAKGWTALVIGGFAGRPFKAYAVEAGASRRGLLPFLVIGGLARAARFLVTASVAARLGTLFHVPPRTAGAAFFAVAIVASLLYLLAVERRWRKSTRA